MISIKHTKLRHTGHFVFFTFLLFIINIIHVSAKASLYDGRDGLNSNDIRCIAKDSRGFVWLGTNSGLNIFDGYTFSKIPGILTNKAIISLELNPETNEMFVGTYTGIFKIDLRTIQTTKINFKGIKKERNSLVRTQSICYNKSNKETYFSLGNRKIAHIAGNRFDIIGQLKDSSKVIRKMTGIDENHLLINAGSLYVFDIKTGDFTPVDNSVFKDEILSVVKTDDSLIICDEEANVYLASAQALIASPRTASIKKIYQLPSRPFKTIFSGNKLYCVSENYSFFISDFSTGETKDISRKYPDIFEGKVFYGLMIDENDLLWVGTNKGLIKIDDHPILFTKELSNNPERVSTREIYEDTNGDIYLCSYIGLWKKPKGKNTWERYEFGNNAEFKNVKNLYTKYVHPLTIIPDHTGNYLYVGMDALTLLKFNKQLKIYENINIQYENPKEFPNDICDMSMDNSGNIWIASTNGLYVYNPKTNIVKKYKHSNFSLGTERVRQVFSDTASNLIYLATIKGLDIIDIKKGPVIHLDSKSNPALSYDDIMYVGKYKNGEIWLGTNGGGVNILSPDLKEVTYIRKQDGLSSEIVYSIVPESSNIYWFGTFNGLDRYKRNKNSFTNFFEEDGLSSNEFNQNSFLRTSEKNFYFGSINGITTFAPHAFAPPKPFHIYFAGISKWDDSTQSIKLFLSDLGIGSTISRNPADQLMELHFSCSDYLDPQRNSYSYRIKEISDKWISLEDRHSLNIGGLPSGHFTLEVKAINAKGGSSSNILLYYLNIRQPFYKTWWFLLILLCFVGLIFYGAYLIKYQNFKKILHLRMKISSNLHDEVGSLLTRITMFSDNLRYSKNTEEQRNIKLEKIANLSRNAVTSMSDVLWTIDSRNDFAGNLLDRMREHAEEMLFPLGIDINFVLSVNDLKRHISSDTRGEIYLIFKEAINNIVKHSDASKVEIYYSLQENRFHLKITNDGVSTAVSEVSTGQGMGNMAMRAKKIGAEVSMKKEGDTFTIELKK